MSDRSPSAIVDRFDAPLGAGERLTTLAALVIGIGGTTVLGVVLTVRTGDVRWLFASLPVTIGFFVLGRLAPAGYRLGSAGVHIERKAGDRVIPYGVIRAVDREPRPVGGVSATASRGLFGWFGRFWNGRLGMYQLFVTDRQRLVWLHTDRGFVGISPARADEFVERLRARLG